MGDSRPLAKQLAERAHQLQQQLQQLQALQALQAQQHAAGGQSFDAEPAAQVVMARQALVQQQLQDQVRPLQRLPRGGALEQVSVECCRVPMTQTRVVR